MNEIVELFTFQFFRNAFLGAILTSILCGIVGTYITSKKMVFISGGLSHAAFGGIGIGYYAGLNPLFPGMLFAALAGLGIEHFSKKWNFRKDSIIAVSWSTGMALGLLLVSLKAGYAPDLMTYLLGNILTISTSELLWLASITLLAVIFFTFFYYRILFLAFDEDYAIIKGINVALFKSILIVLVAITVVVTIRVAGIILILALLTIPQETVNIFTKSFKKIILFSIIIGLFATISGLFASYYYNIITGPVIVLLLTSLYLIARIVKQLMLWKK